MLARQGPERWLFDSISQLRQGTSLCFFLATVALSIVVLGWAVLGALQARGLGVARGVAQARGSSLAPFSSFFLLLSSLLLFSPQTPLSSLVFL